MTQKPMLNLGCGKVILPAPKPEHYTLLADNLTAYPYWHNVDRNMQPGVDEVVDLFRYPFPWADNSFDGALCSHLVEHIPHEIALTCVPKPFQDGLLVPPTERHRQLAGMQDGWYAFFSELYRVCTPGSLIHVLAPYAFSTSAMTDPTHTRYITEYTFIHALTPNEGSTFHYETGGLNLVLDQNIAYRITREFEHLMGDMNTLAHALGSQINVVYELYAQLRVVK